MAKTNMPELSFRMPIPAASRSRLLAWSVHLYTATGLILAGIIAVLIVRGTPQDLALAFVAMWVATLIDASDGYLARALKVKETLPEFDGRRLDDLTDFLTYTFLPLLLIWRAGILPPAGQPVLLFCLVASAYGFCQSDAKTDDGYFLGFPSYWNLVAFYVYILQLSAPVTLTIMIALAVMTFVPVRYLYPSQPGRLNSITLLLALPWGVYLLWLLWRLAWSDGGMVSADLSDAAKISLVFPAYYFGASLVVTFRPKRA